jgi:hypothetical protein
LRVEPLTSGRLPALRAFNQRLSAGGAEWRFPEQSQTDWLPWTPHAPVFQELLLLVDGEAVRGAYALKHQPVSFRGEIRQVGNLYMPLSEGIVNRTYSLAAARLFSDAVRREPLLFALGLGGSDTPASGLVRALGWELHSVPFFFKVLHGSRFLRNIRYLRTSRFRKLLLDLAAVSGMGWLAVAIARVFLTRRPRANRPLNSETVDSFGPWADDLWHTCGHRYSFAAVRTSEVLNRVYRAEREGVFRLRISSAGKVIGYAVIQDEEAMHAELMGGMRVGTIVDALALPEHAEAVMGMATHALERRGVDIIISNQSHPAWGAALRRAGFIEGPSKCVFAMEKRLASEVRSLDPKLREVHLNRGDGDWPWGVDLRTNSSCTV